MFKNYPIAIVLKTALRSFKKDRTTATINLLGVAIALACVLMIAAFVRYELSFDKSYSHSDRIYRLVTIDMRDSLHEESLAVPEPLGNTLKAEFPEVEASTIMGQRQNDFQRGNEVVRVQSIDADSSFFHVFNLPFIEGSPSASLANNDNIVLTESIAKKLFPHQDAMGKMLSYKDYAGKLKSYLVTGIIKDIPSDTHFQAEAIIANTRKAEPLDWRGFGSSGASYILLKKGTDINSLIKKIPSIHEKYHFSNNLKLDFQPVTSIHLHSHVKNEIFQNSDIKYVYIFSSIALLILFIACINYINLTTARSVERVKEVGVRKILGAGKRQLTFQFITESVLLFLIALPVGLLLAWLIWPAFSSVVDINADKLVLFNWPFLMIAILIAVLTGLISGSYPAFILSGLNPVAILHDRKSGFSINLFIRKSLIVFQFVITIGLIVSTIVVYKQLHLLNNMDLGFNKNYLISLPAQNFGNKATALKNELKSGKDIEDVSFSSWEPGDTYGNSSSMEQPGDSTKSWNFGFVNTDTDFLKTMQTKLIAGRNFDNEDLIKMSNYDSLVRASLKSGSNKQFDQVVSSQPIIITKSTAENLGLKQPLVGQKLNLSALQGTIIGEIQDFKGISLVEKSPMVILSIQGDPIWSNTYIRISSKNIPQSISFIEKTWKQFFPGTNFQFQFMDEQIASLYKKQQRLSTLFSGFATLAILISLLGLFSLVALIARQRTKEIGIRKVLGAGVSEIVALLASGFVKLILISFAIVIPIVWWAMNKWLQDFQYRIKISWWIFAIAGLGSLILALLVVSLQAIKTALANPVEALRSE